MRPTRSATSRSIRATAWSAGVTAGGFGHTVKKSLAIGYVAPEAAAPGTALQVEILNDKRSAPVIPESPYDPENKALRA